MTRSPSWTERCATPSTSIAVSVRIISGDHRGSSVLRAESRTSTGAPIPRPRATVCCPWKTADSQAGVVRKPCCGRQVRSYDHSPSNSLLTERV
ncbi:hypothetical protein [Cellulosimicrobium funkei]|uniref:hypothetical protein n=1 Tax=Cellulosimicrobium funkei TaxID=264251 RepID=UPI00375806DD